MKSLDIFLKKNSRVLTILYIILLIIALLLILDKEKVGKLLRLRESFASKNNRRTNKVDDTAMNLPVMTTKQVAKAPTGSRLLIHNLIIFALDKTRPDESIAIKDKYFGSFILTDNIKGRNNNFVYTHALKSNKWSIPNKNAALSNNHTVIDLTYDENRRLMAIGMAIEKGNPVFDIFRKKTQDIKSKWVKLDSNRKIRSLSNDMVYGSLLGCSSYDGQIYESRFKSLSYGDWIGPINYDLPMRKIMYDKEGFMIGIGLIDNFIYKKKTQFWRDSEWDKKNINKTAVYDLIYDYDGCFIATTKNGVMKQLFPDFNSEFVPLDSFNQEHEEIIDHDEVLKYRTGIEFIDDDFDQNTELGRDLKRIYEFKKVAKDLCKSRGRFKKDIINPDKEQIDSNAVSRQNTQINELYDKINVLTDKLNI